MYIVQPNILKSALKCYSYSLATARETQRSSYHTTYILYEYIWIMDEGSIRCLIYVKYDSNANELCSKEKNAHRLRCERACAYFLQAQHHSILSACPIVFIQPLSVRMARPSMSESFITAHISNDIQYSIELDIIHCCFAWHRPIRRGTYAPR